MVTISAHDVTPSKHASPSHGARWLVVLVVVLALLAVAALAVWIRGTHANAPAPAPAQPAPAAYQAGGSVYDEQVPQPRSAPINGQGSTVYQEQVPQVHRPAPLSRAY